jgi:hypothetical protein
MLKKYPILRSIRWWHTLFLLAILIGCVIPLFYFILYRWTDNLICTFNTARKMGVPPDFPSILAHINESVTPGTNRTDVESWFRKIGPIAVYHTNNNHDVSKADLIRLNYCSHPLNNLDFIALYTKDGKLISIRYDGDYP